MHWVALCKLTSENWSAFKLIWEKWIYSEYEERTWREIIMSIVRTKIVALIIFSNLFSKFSLLSTIQTTRINRVYEHSPESNWSHNHLIWHNTWISLIIRIPLNFAMQYGHFSLMFKQEGKYNRQFFNIGANFGCCKIFQSNSNVKTWIGESSRYVIF